MGFWFMSIFLAKRENLKSALHRLKKSIEELQQFPHIETLWDGVIQRFEFTYELAWKTLKAYLEENGTTDLSSAKTVLKEAYAQKLIQHEGIWLSMISDRNLTSHVDEQQMASDILVRVASIYVSEFEQLMSNLDSHEAIKFKCKHKMTILWCNEKMMSQHGEYKYIRKFSLFLDFM